MGEWERQWYRQANGSFSDRPLNERAGAAAPARIPRLMPILPRFVSLGPQRLLWIDTRRAQGREPARRDCSREQHDPHGREHDRVAR